MLLRVLNLTIFTVAVVISGCSSASKNTSASMSEVTKIQLPLSADAVRPVLVGTMSPDIKVRNPSGEEVDLSKVLAGRPSLLIFYRGGWCPYCNLQLSSLQKIEKDIRKLGVQIIAVSPDRPEELIKSVAKHVLNYILISDSDMNAAKAFGIAYRVDDETVEKYKNYKIDLEASSGQNHHGLPVPSLFAIARDGTIAFSYVNPNYKMRPSSDVVFAVARDISKESTNSH
ncbi:MAG: peroxiredoxin-like family protein [Bdellovibrionales bacterium]